MSERRASYGDLPFELREQILACCTRGTLAALSTTARAVTPEAEAMLYEAISLHESRLDELGSCLRTLAGLSHKARLVRSFVVTFVQSRDSPSMAQNWEHIRNVFDLVPLVLRKMIGLKMLSVWPPEDVEMMAVEQVLRDQHFHLERLYIDSVKDFALLLECQPCLEVVCSWSRWPRTVQFEEGWREHRREIVRRRLDTPTHSPSATMEQASRRASPITFGVRYREETRCRTLVIYDYPPISCQGARSLSVASPNVDSSSPWCRLFDISGRNHFLCKIIREDLSIDSIWHGFGDLSLILPDLSPPHLSCVLTVLSQLLGCYTYIKPNVVFLVINPPETSLDMEALYEPFKNLLTALIVQEVGSLQIRQFGEYLCRCSVGYRLSEVDAQALSQGFARVVREVVEERLGRNGEFRFCFDFGECRFLHNRRLFGRSAGPVEGVA